jgi:hypothetical protein
MATPIIRETPLAMSKADAETLRPLGSSGQGIPTKLEHVAVVMPPPTIPPAEQ